MTKRLFVLYLSNNVQLLMNCLTILYELILISNEQLQSQRNSIFLYLLQFKTMSFKLDFIFRCQEIESSKSEKNIFQINIKNFADANGFIAFYHFDKLKDVSREIFSSKEKHFLLCRFQSICDVNNEGKSTD